MLPDKERLLKIIEQKLDWGESETWQSRDFENLNERILDETGVSLSASTLRRIWGRVAYKHLPSSTTLDTLAKFAGYESWRMFIKQTAATDAVGNTGTVAPPAVPVPASRSRYWIAAACVVILIIAASVAGVLAFKKAPPAIKPGSYTFSSKPLTRTLPNSVVFSYDATASPTDSVYIQQSWDPTTKTAVDKNAHQHTSVYYEPGFYQAKLVIGSQVVQQHDLIIPTNGWLGIIENKPVPVYLETGEFVHKDGLNLPVAGITQKNINMQPSPPVIKYSNVGNFDAVDISNFSFSADIKNEYRQGANACQLSAIFLITNGSPIIIPLSVKGCASELNLLSVDQMVSGKKADLSSFGVDLSQWVNVSCKSTATTIQYYVNGRQAYECPLPAVPVKIVGMQYVFQGTGTVKNVSLSGKGKMVFKAF